MSLLRRLQREQAAQEAKGEERGPNARSRGPALRPPDPMQLLKSRVREQLVAQIDVAELEETRTPEEKASLAQRVGEVLDQLTEASGEHLGRAERQRLLQEILDEMTGFGPINALILDDSVSEIMVNGPRQVFIERHGRLEPTEVRFRDDAHVLQVIERIVAPLGRRIDESSPMVDARLPDGSRVNAIIPPLALNGPVLTIRKFAKDPLTVEDLIRFGSLSRSVADFLEACVKAALNIVVSGGTGSGKCLQADTPVVLADGQVCRIGELVERRLAEGPAYTDGDGWTWTPGRGQVLSFDPASAALIARPIEAFWRHPAPDRLVRVTLASGAQMVVTPEHPFYTRAGDRLLLKRADALRTGDAVAVPVAVDVPGRPFDVFAALAGTDDLFVSGQAKAVRAAATALARRVEQTPVAAAAAALGVSATLVRRWWEGQPLSLARLAALLQRAAGAAQPLGATWSLRARGAKAPVRVTRTAAPAFWRWIGLLIGAGRTSPSGVSFVHAHLALHREFAALTAQSFGLAARRRRKANGVWESQIASRTLAVLLQRLFGAGLALGCLRLPPAVFALPRADVEALLSGLAAAHGSSRGDAGLAAAESYRAASREEADAIAYLLLRLGRRAQMRPQGAGGCMVTASGWAAGEQATPGAAAGLAHAAAGPAGLAPAPQLLPLGDLALIAASALASPRWGALQAASGAAGATDAAQGGPASAVGPAAVRDRCGMSDWEPVADIEVLTAHGERYVYDLTVRQAHTFVGGHGGVIAHNTTLLNVLSSFIPADERIVTIEDAAELQLRQEHVVRLESRPPNVEGRGAITIRDLVRNALRMRPDRIVVGEVRGGEALDMLQAMNTGHDGSLTTGHANSPRDMLARLETMVLMAGMEFPVRAIREQIAAAVDLIVQTERLRDGSRRLTRITEVQGMEGEVITLQDIFVFEQTGIDEQGKVVGRLRPTGIRPKFMDRFAAAGIEVPLETFLPDT